jgi:hypothetical protein
MADPTLQDLIARIDKLEASLTRVPNIIADPAPDPWGGGGGPWGGNPWGPILQNFGQLSALARGVRPIPDPPPFDLSRFNKAQLSMTKEMLKTERLRLDAMEKLIDDQIKAIK